MNVMSVLVCASLVFIVGAQKREASKEVRSKLFQQVMTDMDLRVMSQSTSTLADNTRNWTGTLPENGDYIIIVDGDERGGTYTMTISIK